MVVSSHMIIIGWWIIRPGRSGDTAPIDYIDDTCNDGQIDQITKYGAGFLSIPAMIKIDCTENVHEMYLPLKHHLQFAADDDFKFCCFFFKNNK